MTYELRRQPNGAYSLFNAGLRETMHPHVGPWEEATRLYVGGSGLEALLAGKQAAPKKRKKPRMATSAPVRTDLVLFDVGLGGAANALAAIACRAGLVRKGHAALPLILVSFEQDLEALAFAIDHAEPLGYVGAYRDALRAILVDGIWEAHGVRWELRQGDFPALIDQEPRRADVVFFDPFSHRTNPAMWSVAVFESLYRCRRPGSGQRLVTYSSAYSVRAAMFLAGYYVGDSVRLEGRPTTIAASEFSDLAEPLDGRWLNRWRKDREPWPPFTAPAKHKDLRQALVDHPQWVQLDEQGEGSEPVRRPPRPAYRRHASGRPARPAPKARGPH